MEHTSPIFNINYSQREREGECVTFKQKGLMKENVHKLRKMCSEKRKRFSIE